MRLRYTLPAFADLASILDYIANGESASLTLHFSESGESAPPPKCRGARANGGSSQSTVRPSGSTLDDGNVVLALEIKPELCTVPKIATKPNRCIGGNRPATVEYVGNGARRYPEVECESICAEFARF
jgi:hypothetical protein